jgi:two-component system, NarL family, invasion response regulator UvrY
MEQVSSKILLVDDSDIILNRMQILLQSFSYISMVKIACSFEDARNFIEEYQFDIVILDINIPGKSGIELLGFIKKEYPLIKVIMHTNQSNDFYKKRCTRLGCDAYIDKSGEYEEISSVIQQFTSRIHCN